MLKMLGEGAAVGSTGSAKPFVCMGHTRPDCSQGGLLITASRLGHKHNIGVLHVTATA
jgi:hypothetical protein